MTKTIIKNYCIEIIYVSSMVTSITWVCMLRRNINVASAIEVLGCQMLADDMKISADKCFLVLVDAPSLQEKLCLPMQGARIMPYHPGTKLMWHKTGLLSIPIVVLVLKCAQRIRVHKFSAVCYYWFQRILFDWWKRITKLASCTQLDI